MLSHIEEKSPKAMVGGVDVSECEEGGVEVSSRCRRVDELPAVQNIGRGVAERKARASTSAGGRYVARVNARGRCLEFARLKRQRGGRDVARRGSTGRLVAPASYV